MSPAEAIDEVVQVIELLRLLRNGWAGNTRISSETRAGSVAHYDRRIEALQMALVSLERQTPAFSDEPSDAILLSIAAKFGAEAASE